MKHILTKFIALIKAMFVHISLSLRVGITRSDEDSDEKALDSIQEDK